MTVLSNARVVTEQETIDPGWIRLQGNKIAEVGRGNPPITDEATEHLDRPWLVPGFVDIHVHGGSGASYASGDPEQVRTALEYHRQHGTTTTVASIATASLSQLEETLKILAYFVEDGLLRGVHLEGPFLSKPRRGGHDPAFLRKPDVAELERLLEAGRGTVRQVTIAPELPGATKLIRQIVASDVVAAVGHTDGTFEQGLEAFDAGATVATHLYNGMRTMHHREPGLVIAALEDPRVTLELINDGVHIHDAILKSTFSRAGCDRIALVTDASAVAGMGNGSFCDNSARPVQVVDQTVRLGDTDTLAGTTFTMDMVLRRTVRDVGIPIVETVRSLSTTPARALGLHDIGVIRPGADADLVLLDDDFTVSGVMVRGCWLPGRQP